MYVNREVTKLPILLSLTVCIHCLCLFVCTPIFIAVCFLGWVNLVLGYF